MATEGPLIAGTGADDATVGSLTWTAPENITASDDTRASVIIGGGATTHYLKATNFGFAIPAGATIDGIEVRFERQKSGASSVTDVDVMIVKGGAISVTDLSAGAAWNNEADQLDTFGGATELWGETWTATDINASNFGVVVAATSAGATALVDSVDIKIYYTAAVAGFDPNGMQGFFGL